MQSPAWMRVFRIPLLSTADLRHRQGQDKPNILNSVRRKACFRLPVGPRRGRWGAGRHASTGPGQGVGQDPAQALGPTLSSSPCRRVGTSSRRAWWRPRLRAHSSAIVLDGEDMAVKGRGPSLRLHGQIEITQRVAQIALNLAPIELRIMVDQIGRRAIAELLVNAGFGEFVKERVQLAGIERVTPWPIRSPARTKPASVSVAA